MKEDLQSFGVALGGGAFRGAAHLGVLKALEEEGLKPGFLAGTSAGAMVAAFYAFGVSPEEIRQLARELKWLRVSSFTLSKMGLLSNAEIGRFMEQHLGNVLLEDAPIPLAVVATNIQTGEKVVIKSGPVSHAVMASTCIPGLFTPVQTESQMLVDGMLVENVPVSVLKAMGAPLSVAVHLSSDHYRKPQSLAEVLLNALSVAVDQTTQRQLAQADVIVHPNLDGYGLMDPGNSVKLYAEGYRAGVLAVEHIRQELEKRGPSSFEILEKRFRQWLHS